MKILGKILWELIPFTGFILGFGITQIIKDNNPILWGILSGLSVIAITVKMTILFKRRKRYV